MKAPDEKQAKSEKRTGSANQAGARAETRADRLAAALRDNLKKRKAQARQRMQATIAGGDADGSTD